MPTAAFTTLGCKVNQYETQRILESFESAGFAVVPFDSPADVYVINTCSVTSIAESKSRYTVRKATRNNPTARVVVTGCAMQMAINKDEPIEGTDVIVPNPDKLNALGYFMKAFPEFAARLKSEPKPPINNSLHTRTRATLKIQDGCSVHCSYCSIPFTRPGMVSRPWRDVIVEAEKMAEMGYREIVLTGVLIGAYGPESGSEGPDFETLVERLSEVEGIARLRISSIEMPQVSDRLIELIKSGKVVPHLHIPLQCGDTEVLQEMNRRYTQDDYLRLCDKLYAQLPDISITTDIMVGFPTETEERFQSSLHVCEEAKYLKAHVFRFSPRFGTPADQWGDPISPQEKTERSHRIQEIANRTADLHMRKFLGRTMRVLVEGKIDQEGLLSGLTDNYLEVKFAGPQSLRRQIAWVRLDEVRDGAVFGELVSEPAEDTHSKGQVMLPMA
ncbi:MAG: tRNA (N(6)-L-threonylcarbamoyladenosine(37)-C(2))-methylthiotransferase MtaB [Fimbriimonadaceae bacterium]|nr:tRNA (N(6)-L-threonylcarbamoyladenosine(37)-C(2))-methylthiotransferase MtaB [Fimbriimonadaceae bacterium]